MLLKGDNVTPLLFKPMLVLTSILAFATIAVGEEEVSTLPTLEYVYRALPDSTKNCYLKVIPHHEKVEGLLVFMTGKIPKKPRTRPPSGLSNLAAERGIMTIYCVTTDIFSDFHVREKSLGLLDDIIQEVIEQHQISPGKFVTIGGSLSGACAAKFAQFCAEGKSKYDLSPAGILLIDPVLDFERMWREQSNAFERNFNKAAYEEGKWILPIMRKIFGGSPSENLNAYHDLSPFCYSAKEGGNAKLLKNTRIRMITEVDVHWWIENRGKDYYDINAIDCAALTNQMKLFGNDKVDLIITSGKGYREDGTRHPHSWTVVDEQETMNWIVETLAEAN
jgi:hypothetical protein